MRSASASATALLPLAVGPKMARTIGVRAPGLMRRGRRGPPSASSLVRKEKRMVRALRREGAHSRGRKSSFGAAQRRGRRCLDPHVDEITWPGRAAEVDRRVTSGAPAQDRGVGAARALDEDLLHSADPALIPCLSDPLDDIDEPLDPPP